MVRAVGWLALMVPELVSAIWPAPMFPDPWIVSPLVRLLVAAEPKIELFGLFPIVSVPPPLRVTFDEPIISCVALFDEFREMFPALLMLVPLTFRVWLSLTLRLSSESTVRLLATPPMSSVTADTPCPLALPLSISTFVPLVGTPFDQLAELLQTPEAPPTQHVPPAGQVNEIKGMLVVLAVKAAADRLLMALQSLVPLLQVVLRSRAGVIVVLRLKAPNRWW